MATTRFYQALQPQQLLSGVTLGWANGQLVFKDSKGQTISHTTLSNAEIDALIAQAPAPTPPAPPAPTPDPSTGGTTKGFDGFGAGSWPPATWRPYATSSVWNTPIDGMGVHERSDAYVANLVRLFGKPNVIKGGMSSAGVEEYGHPVYYAQPDDPIYTLRSTESNYNIAQGEQVRAPAKMRPAFGSDAHLSIVTPSGVEYFLWNASISGATITYGIGSRSRIDGSGMDQSATALHAAAQAGIMRGEELLAGEINHALFAVVQYGSDAGDFGNGVVHKAGQADYVSPATKGDSHQAGANLLPMGARVSLNYTDAEIAALSIPTWKKAFVRALARYGFIFGDTGGTGFGFQFLAGTMYTSLGATDPIVTLAKREGMKPSGGIYQFDLASGIDWTRLQVRVP